MIENTEKRGRGRPRKPLAKSGAQRQAEYIAALKSDRATVQHIIAVLDAAPEDAMFSVSDIYRMISDGRLVMLENALKGRSK